VHRQYRVDGRSTCPREVPNVWAQQEWVRFGSIVLWEDTVSLTMTSLCARHRLGRGGLSWPFRHPCQLGLPIHCSVGSDG
jgi:hypothetical protein